MFELFCIFLPQLGIKKRRRTKMDRRKGDLIWLYDWPINIWKSTFWEEWADVLCFQQTTCCVYRDTHCKVLVKHEINNSFALLLELLVKTIDMYGNSNWWKLYMFFRISRVLQRNSLKQAEARNTTSCWENFLFDFQFLLRGKQWKWNLSSYSYFHVKVVG